MDYDDDEFYKALEAKEKEMNEEGYEAGGETEVEREDYEHEDGSIAERIGEIAKAPVVVDATLIPGPGLGSIDGLDLLAVSRKETATFSRAQDAKMSLLILQIKTYQVGNFKKEFEALLSELGFLNKELHPTLLTLLRNKVRHRLEQLRNIMIKSGSARMGSDGELEFALWAEKWELPDWDGDITGPSSKVQKAFESGFN